MAKMRVVQVTQPKAPFQIVERDIPEPPAGSVRIKVQACGICHSDAFVKDGGFPGNTYPRVPGHEVAGVVDAIGPGVTQWKVGERVGTGWHAGQCGQCTNCRRGDFFACPNAGITGLTMDGGYGEYMIARAIALAPIPETLTPVEAAPLMCAGVTTYNALRNSGARAGDLVAVLGLGGLGHLGVQFAAKMGFHTVAIARGKDKEAFARQLGAHVYLDSQAVDPAAELQKLGGARIVLATVVNGDAMAATLRGLAPNGTLMMLGVPDALTIQPGYMINGKHSIRAWYSGTAIDSQDTLAFSVVSGVRPMNEVFPLEKVSEAYARMESGKARLRVVLTTGH